MSTESLLQEIKDGVDEILDAMAAIEAGTAPQAGSENVVRVEFAKQRTPQMKWRDGGTPLTGIDHMTDSQVRARSFCGRYLITAVKGNSTIDELSVSGRHNPRFHKAPGSPELVKGLQIREGDSVAVDTFLGPLDGRVEGTWEQVGWVVKTKEQGVIINVGRQIAIS